jgi:hypothetical protein
VNRRNDIPSCSLSFWDGCTFSRTSLNIKFDGDVMQRNQREEQSSPRAVDLIGCSAQLYEFHEATAENKKLVGLAQWLKPVEDRTITIAACSVDCALTYLRSNVPDFKVQTVTPLGSVIVVTERA